MIDVNNAVGMKVLTYGRHPGVRGVIQVEGVITKCFTSPCDPGRRGWLVMVDTKIGVFEKRLEDCRPADAVSRLGGLAR